MRYQDQKVEPSRFVIIRWFGFDQFVPETIVTSHWVSSKTFFAIRFIVALYSTVVLWTDIGVTNSGKFFQFFTTLTFVGLHAYLITSCVHHFRYLQSKNVDFILHQPAFINYLYVYLHSTVVTFNIVTPVVFWSILAKYSNQTNTVGTWMNVSVHGVSFFLMIIDVIFNRMKLSVRMIIFPLITMILYMFMAFIIYAVNGYWVYPFLDWSQGPTTAIWYFAVAIISVVAFFIQVLIHWLRDFIARKLGKVEQEQLTEKVESGQSMSRLDTSTSGAV